jgi:uncharacterized integral membrane protein
MKNLKVGDPVEVDKSGRWLGPVLFLFVVVTPVLILIFSNLTSAVLHFAGYEWKAPLWLVLAVTFVAGAIVTRLFGAVWRHHRKHQRQLNERAAAGRQGDDH